jgi:3-methyl-2-oxobutanoate hydroxymethyltransferase
MECIPAELAALITASVGMPTIGIGAGPDCDGQVLVLYDMLGITPGKVPKFVRNFLQGADSVPAAIRAYVDAVRDGSFPAPEHCF